MTKRAILYLFCSFVVHTMKVDGVQCFSPNILPNIFCCVSQKKESQVWNIMRASKMIISSEFMFPESKLNRTMKMKGEKSIFYRKIRYLTSKKSISLMQYIRLELFYMANFTKTSQNKLLSYTYFSPVSK